MNVFAKFDEILSMILQDIKKQNVTDTKTFRTQKRFGHTVGQRENSIPSHKHSLRGGYNNLKNIHARVMVLVHDKWSQCALQMYGVSLKYL